MFQFSIFDPFRINLNSNKVNFSSSLTSVLPLKSNFKQLSLYNSVSFEKSEKLSSFASYNRDN